MKQPTVKTWLPSDVSQPFILEQFNWHGLNEVTFYPSTAIKIETPPVARFIVTPKPKQTTCNEK